LAKKGINASALVAKKNPIFIEIRPSGTSGKGKNDRIVISVDKNTIEVVEVGASTHK
jgi:hypothetical protein